MSEYPKWWDATITIYNKYVDTDRVVKWYKSVVTNCFWKNTDDKVTVGGVVINTDSIICRIPKSNLYKGPSEWHNLSDVNKHQYFTLKQGDIIVHGIVSDTIDEYKSKERSSDLLAKYHELDSCLEIKKVTNNDVTGMVNPYYYVKGI